MVQYLPQRTFNSGVWGNEAALRSGLRQRMLADLVCKVLPGMTGKEIEALLGPSPTHEEMRRHTSADLKVKVRAHDGSWQPYPRSGVGWYYDEYEWDMIYRLGKEKIIIWDHNGQEFSPDDEFLLIRLDAGGSFESFYVIGSQYWPTMLGDDCAGMFRRKR